MPIHPTLVRVGEKTCFLKLAARGQEPAVKREIKFLADFKKKDLYGQGLRAPRLEGVVTLPSTPESHSIHRETLTQKFCSQNSDIIPLQHGVKNLGSIV